MKRVAILSGQSPIDKRGLPVVALTHAKGMRQLGYDAFLYCRGERHEKYEIEGVPIYTFSYHSRRNAIANFASMGYQCLQGWQRHFGRIEPDILHGHDYLTYYFLSWKLSSGVKKFFTVHDPLIYHQRMLGNVSQVNSYKGKMMACIEDAVYSRSQKIHVISQYSLNRLNSRARFDYKCKVVPNWVDMERFDVPYNKQQIRTELGLNPIQFVIYTLRALEPRMGISNLIESFAILKHSIPNCLLFIGGKGSLRNELEVLARNLKCDDEVKLLGYVDDETAVKWYQAADVVVIPSIDGEGFGLPVLESMACGTPVLATPVCALPEVMSRLPERLFSGISPGEIAQGILTYNELWKIRKPNPQFERAYVANNYSENEILRIILSDYEQPAMG